MRELSAGPAAVLRAQSLPNGRRRTLPTLPQEEEKEKQEPLPRWTTLSQTQSCCPVKHFF
ncbi:MAG: hypothetical protein Kow00111_24440 [Thermincola ferriacetica]